MTRLARVPQSNQSTSPSNNALDCRLQLSSSLYLYTYQRNSLNMCCLLHSLHFTSLTSNRLDCRTRNDDVNVYYNNFERRRLSSHLASVITHSRRVDSVSAGYVALRYGIVIHNTTISLSPSHFHPISDRLELCMPSLAT